MSDAKKDFSGGLNNLLGSNKDTTKKRVTKKKAAPKANSKKKAAPKVAAKANTKKKEATKEKAAPKRGVGRPRTTSKRAITKESQRGTKEGETRVTYILQEKLIEQIKDIAYWEREQLKDLVGDVLSKFVKDYIKKNKELKPRPIRK